MRFFLSLVLLIIACNNSLAQTWQDTIKIIDHFFDQYHVNKPGGQLAISRYGKIVYSRAWGLSDIESNTKYTINTVSEAGSISKQFVAAAILILEQQKKISLSDDVRKYISEFPDYSHKITLSHLIHHTSGIKEWSSLVALTGWPRTTKAYRNCDALNYIYSQKSLNNEPGSEYIYSNSNYILLTEIVERVSGLSLQDFTQKYMFKPAGMTNTTWRDNFRKVVKNRAISYSRKDRSYLIDMPNESVYGPGGLLTTCEDLLKWNYFFLSDKLGLGGLLQGQLKRINLTTDAVNNYAAGLFVEELNGQQKIFHTGQTAGYIGILESFPEKGLSIAWLSNTTEHKNNLFFEIGEIEKLLTSIPNNNNTLNNNMLDQHSKHSKLSLDNKCGWYIHEKTNEGFQITKQGDTLFLQHSPLLPIEGNSFKYLASQVEFINKKQFTLTTPDHRKILFNRLKKFQKEGNISNSILGTYLIEELNCSFKIFKKSGKLFLNTGYINVPLEETFIGGFNFSIFIDSGLFPENFNIYFNGFSSLSGEISTNNARKIKFKKLHKTK